MNLALSRRHADSPSSSRTASASTTVSRREWRWAVVASAVVAVDLWAAATKKAIIVVTNTAGSGFVTGDNPVGAATPWAWSANDKILLNFSYEASTP